MHKTVPLLLALILLLAGCTTPSSPKGKPQFAPANLRQATVYVFDEIPGVVGPGEVVVANGTPIGPISRRQYTWFYTRPGILDLSIHDRLRDGRLLATGQFPVRAGRSYYIRYRMLRYERSVTDTNGLSKDPGPIVYVQEGNLEEVTESKGIEMAGTHRLVDTYAPTTVVREQARPARVDYK